MASKIPTFEDAVMPRSTIKNLAKQVLRPDTVIQKAALTALAEGSTVFISYLTTHANEIALSKKRKTIMPNDVLEALKEIEFQRFLPALKEEHEELEQSIKDRRARKKQQDASNGDQDPVDATNDLDDESPASKKAKIEASAAQSATNPSPDRVAEDNDHHDEEEGEDIEEEEGMEEEEEDEEEELDEGEEEDDPVKAIDPVEDIIDADVLERQDTYDEVLDNGEDSD